MVRGDDKGHDPRMAVAKKKVAKKPATETARRKPATSAKKTAKKKLARKRLEVPEFILEPFEACLPIHGEGFSLELASVTEFGWGRGLFGILRSTAGARTCEAEVPLLRDEELTANWDEVKAALGRWRVRVAALSAAEVERLGIKGLQPWAKVSAEELERRYAEYLAFARPETPAATEQRRRAALEQAYADFPRLAAHVQSVWGLPLPRTLAVYDAFHRAIAALPSAVREASQTWPGGILDRLGPRGWSLVLRPGLDERVHCRFRQDPPEMLSFAWGNSDGQHFGLWYDAADEAIAVVHNYARDSAETWIVGEHPLAVCRSRWHYDEPPSGEAGFSTRLYLDELAWFEAEELRVAGKTAAQALGRRPALLGGPGSVPAAVLPLDTEGRIHAYRNDPERVLGWLAEARAQLARGDAALALALARELHWFDHDRYREEAGALFVAAYEALGRTAHAGILRAHLAFRNELSVHVFAEPEDVGE